MAEVSTSNAEALLREWTQSESLVKHGLAVACCTESYGAREAARLGLEGDDAAQFVALSLIGVRGYCTILTTSGIRHRRSIRSWVSLICASKDGRKRCCMRSSHTRIIPA